MLFRFFRPDMAFYDIYVLDPEYLSSLGVEGVVFDIDNTVVAYDAERPDQRITDYFDRLQENGIKLAFVSNNKLERVSVFNESLCLFYVCKAGKPSPKGICKCIEHFGLDKEKVLAVGDQIFTDCIAAHRAGVRFALVKPIKKKENAFFRLKRFCERPFVKGLKWISKKRGGSKRPKRTVRNLRIRRKKK